MATYVNNHIHTVYSFSPYTPTTAVEAAKNNGLKTAGIMDHDSVGGAREFIEAGKKYDMPVTVGVECRADMSKTALAGKRINNPDQLSVAYVAMHGIPHQNIERVDSFFAPLRQRRNVRNRAMCENINKLTAAYGITLSLIVQRWGNRATPLFIVALLGLSCVTANVFILIPAMIGVMIPLSVGLRGTGRVVLPYLQATLTETLGVAEKGMYISSFMALRSLFAFLSTSSGGVLYKITPELPFIMEGLCGVVWVLLFAWFTKGRRPDAIDVGPVGVAAMKEKEPSISNT